MKFCEYCGTKLFAEDRTCPKCGAPVTEDIKDSNQNRNTNRPNNNNNFNSTNNTNAYNQNRNINNNRPINNSASKKQTKSFVPTIVFILMVLSCIGLCWLVIPLVWLIPMTLYYYNLCVKHNGKVSMFFKVCTLIFCNFLAGVILIVSN